LKSVLKAAASLQISGLAGISPEEKSTEEVSPTPVAKRQRTSSTTTNQSEENSAKKSFIGAKTAAQEKQNTTLETTTEIPDDTMVMDSIIVEELPRPKEEITLTSDGEEVENVVETIVDETLDESYRMDIHLNASGRELNSSAVNRLQQANAIPQNRVVPLERTPLRPGNQVMEPPLNDSTPGKTNIFLCFIFNAFNYIYFLSYSACSSKTLPFACPFCNRNYSSFVSFLYFLIMTFS